VSKASTFVEVEESTTSRRSRWFDWVKSKSKTSIKKSKVEVVRPGKVEVKDIDNKFKEVNRTRGRQEGHVETD
jgi:hypothetical protein